MKTPGNPAKASATGVKRRELAAKISLAYKHHEAARQAAKEARAEFRRVRKAHRQAKQAAKEARKAYKALKKELAAAKALAKRRKRARQPLQPIRPRKSPPPSFTPLPENQDAIPPAPAPPSEPLSSPPSGSGVL